MIYTITIIFGILIIISHNLLNKKIILLNDRLRKVHTIPIINPLDYTGYPLLTFKCGSIPVTFLVDSGASHSWIEQTLLSQFNIIVTENTDPVTKDCNGNVMKSDYKAHIMLEHNRAVIPFIFNTGDLETTFKYIGSHKLDYKIQGIVGMDFLSKYKCVIDCDNKEFKLTQIW